MLPKGLNKTVMRAACGLQVLDSLLQVLDSLLEYIAFEFQSLDLIFEALGCCYIVACDSSIYYQKSIEQDLL